MPVIYGLSWKHPAVILILTILICGGVAIYLENTVPIGTRGSGPHRGNLHMLLAMVGLFFWAGILLHMIGFPEKYLPERSLLLDAEVYERREKLVQWAGYALGISTLLFAIYKISLLAPSQ